MMTDERTPYTYDQAATALGINGEAVRARARRGALRRGPRTNDGRPTVLLSPDDVASIRAGNRPAVRPEPGPDPDGQAVFEALRGTIAILERELAHERERTAEERAARLVADANAAGEVAKFIQYCQSNEGFIRQLQSELANGVQKAEQAMSKSDRLDGELGRVQAELTAIRKRGWLARLLGRA